MDEQQFKMGLYDSDTGASLEAIRVVDITDLQRDYHRVLLAFTQAKRGRIVQIVMASDEGDATGTRIHYFLDEPGGARMIEEDEVWLGFDKNVLTDAIVLNAPEAA